jgi:hypothetical protein
VLGKCPNRKVLWQPQVRASANFRFDEKKLVVMENMEFKEAEAKGL